MSHVGTCGLKYLKIASANMTILVLDKYVKVLVHVLKHILKYLKPCLLYCTVVYNNTTTILQYMYLRLRYSVCPHNMRG